MSEKMYCLVYRTGGTDNFKWNHSLGMSKPEAIAKKPELEKMGYPTMIYKWEDLTNIGMPETF